MFKLQPLKDGAKEMPGITLKDFILLNVKYNTKNPLPLTRELRRRFGEVYKVTIFKEGLVFLASQRMVAPILSMPDCVKVTHPFLAELRSGNGRDGLFTMYNEEPEWAAAHRLLIPAFGAMSIRGMYDQMADILTSMLTRWSAYENTVVNLPDQLTRLTLDTIALCSFDYRFNSFFKHEMHPFVNDMLIFLSSNASRALNPVIAPLRVDLLYKAKAARTRMADFGNKLIQERKKGSSNADDLCSRMLNLADPETGEKLSDKNIEAQLLTFLVAGHETTSGMLSFCLYFMMRNPETMRKAQAEVDALGQITRDSLTKLPYIEACLKEALRLEPTAPMFAVRSQQECPLADGFVLPPGQEVMIDLHGLHRDPEVFPDPEAFKPERMLDFDGLPPHAWKPFGNGIRACIGRAFAMQESILAIAGIVQNFDLELADPNYKFRTKFTLTIKPDKLMVRMKKRHACLKLPLASHLKPVPVPTPSSEDEKAEAAKLSSSHPMTILFGSEAGSCQMLAKEIQVEATSRGFVATLNTLDSCAALPTDQPVVIVTSSYDGQPPSNAKKFVKNLESGDAQSLKGVSFALFGAGHHECVDTYQAVPKLVDELLQKQGATSIIARGLGDVAGDFVQPFEDWKSDLFTALISTSSDTLTLGSNHIENFRVLPKKAVHEDAKIGEVCESSQLAAATERGLEKFHTGINLPETVFQPGDYLDVFPVNSTSLVLSVLQKFTIDEDTMISVADGQEHKTVKAFDYLRHNVDLSKPAPRYALSTLSKHCGCPNDQETVKTLQSDSAMYTSEIQVPYVTLLELLKKFRSCKLPFESFLECLEPLRSRRYSISSAPSAGVITLTYDVSGLTTKFMQSLHAGDSLTCSIRPSQFHLPADPKTPILCLAAGTGIAPFRSFFEHRMHQISQKMDVAPAVLYYGCRNSADQLYAEDFEKWNLQSGGLLTTITSFSRHEAPEYVQDRILLNKQAIFEQVQNGAEIYVCGGIAFATSLRGAWTKMAEDPIYKEVVDITNSARYKVDIFG